MKVLTLVVLLAVALAREADEIDFELGLDPATAAAMQVSNSVALKSDVSGIRNELELLKNQETESDVTANKDTTAADLLTTQNAKLQARLKELKRQGDEAEKKVRETAEKWEKRVEEAKRAARKRHKEVLAKSERQQKRADKRQKELMRRSRKHMKEYSQKALYATRLAAKTRGGDKRRTVALNKRIAELTQSKAKTRAKIRRLKRTIRRLKGEHRVHVSKSAARLRAAKAQSAALRAALQAGRKAQNKLVTKIKALTRKLIDNAKKEGKTKDAKQRAALEEQAQAMKKQIRELQRRVKRVDQRWRRRAQK